MSGLGTAAAGAAPGGADAPLASPGAELVPGELVDVELVDAAGTHPADDVALGDTVDCAEALWVLPGLGCVPPGVVPPAVGVAVPSVACVPLPSVPALPCFGPFPPERTVVLAWMIAWRNGCTPSETLAMTAIPPSSTTTGRSHPMSHWGDERDVPPAPAPSAAGRGSRRSRGHGRSAARRSGSGHAQCPRHVRYRTRSAPSASTLSSQGRGGRLPMRARILSSPAAPGSISLTAAARALRSARSKRSSGGVIASPAVPATS
jgi:hypothetical protein